MDKLTIIMMIIIISVIVLFLVFTLYCACVINGRISREEEKKEQSQGDQK